MDMNFDLLFGVFSKRSQAPTTTDKPLTREFRNRVLFACRDTFYGQMFWPQMHRRFQYLLGRQLLGSNPHLGPAEDVVHFLNECRDAHFLDFLELIFQPPHEEGIAATSAMVGNVNEFFRIDDLPYSLTDFVWVSLPDRPHVSDLVEYPQIIRRDNEVLYKIAIEPTLTFLKHPAFASANKEFLGALSDYRKDDFQDCVVKCNSSFESVMKIICDLKHWSYPGNADAINLIGIMLPKTNLPSFYKTRLQVVPITRNEKSSAHGAGSQPRVVDRHVAEFAINSTAAAILLLVGECL